MDGKILFCENYILLDIEGTVTSLSFVKDLLFPYIKKHLKDYVEQNWSTDEFTSIVGLLKEQCITDKQNKEDGLLPIIEHDKESVIQNILWLMDKDKKVTALKKLQGYIWRDGFISGKLKGHIYEDVVPELRIWKQQGKKLYIYSSGSVEAQKLLFGHSVIGNLLDLFSGYFDTEIGSKIQSESYTNIANVLKTSPSNILFLTDIVEEADAAEKAGYRVVVVERPGNIPISSTVRNKYTLIKSFHQLMPSSGNY